MGITTLTRRKRGVFEGVDIAQLEAKNPLPKARYHKPEGTSVPLKIDQPRVCEMMEFGSRESLPEKATLPSLKITSPGRLVTEYFFENAPLVSR